MKFSGYCSLYDTNYYSNFIVDKHAFKESDGRVVPVLKNYDLKDVNNAIGCAKIEDTDTGVMAHCTINDDADINENTVLDAHIISVIRSDENPAHIECGMVRAIYITTKEACPLHNPVVIEEE